MKNASATKKMASPTGEFQEYHSFPVATFLIPLRAIDLL